MLAYEHEQRLRLEEMVEQLAKQHSSFEKQAKKTLARATNSKLTDTNQNKGQSRLCFAGFSPGFIMVVLFPKPEMYDGSRR